MEWIILGIVGGISVYLLNAWTKYTYYEGMKAGMKIQYGLQHGENIKDLHNKYDKYKGAD